MWHAKYCIQYTVLHFALQRIKKAGRAGRRRFAMARHRFKVRKTSVSLAATSCPSWSRACAHARHIRTQACLSRRDQMIVARRFIAWNPVQKGIRPVGTV